MEQQKPKRIPYGKQNWEDVRLSNFYYVDKTRFIPEIEAANEYFFFIRPRRFGKSLMLSTLQAMFEGRRDLFKGLAILHDVGLDTGIPKGKEFHLQVRKDLPDLFMRRNRESLPYES